MSPGFTTFRLVSPPTQTVARSQTNPAATSAAPVYSLTKTPIKDIKVGTRVPAFDPQLGTEIREAFAEPNWAQWIKLNLEMTKSDGSLLKMEMLRHEDWVLENIDYQFLAEEDLKATSLLTAANSSQFLKSLPLEAPQVPLRTLFAELHDVRWLMAEVEADAVLVTISLDLPEIGVRGEAVVTGVEPCPVILPGPGKVVLTTFHHASSHLIDLYLSPQPPAHLQQIQGGQQILDHDRWGRDSSASSPELAPRPIPAREADTAFDPVRRTGSTTVQTAEEALLFPQVSRSSVVDQSWERIGVTGNHPIWSEDRHDYIAAMDLRVGERLKNLSGDTVWVQQKLPRPGPTPVYNLEVQDEHVYYVGTNGVLAHNVGKGKNKCSDEDTSGHGKKLARDMERRGYERPEGMEAAHMVPTGKFGNRASDVQQAIATAHLKFDKFIGHGSRDTLVNGFWAEKGHAGTHTDKYFLELGEALRGAGSKRGVIKALNKMWKRIKHGKYM